jgi:hypothetical protein
MRAMDLFLKVVVLPAAVGVLFFPLVISIIRRADGPPGPLTRPVLAARMRV